MKARAECPPIFNITYGFPFFHPFGLKDALCCVLHILAKLIDEHSRTCHTVNRLPCTVTACHGAGAKKACICFCAITLYTLRPLNNVLYPLTMFFSLRTHSLPFQTVLYSSCSSHLINLSTIDANFQGGRVPLLKF